MLSFALEYLAGIEMNEFSGSKQPGAMLWSMNHRSRIDWMMVWMLLPRFEVAHCIVFITHVFNRYLPVIGWLGCWCAIFLRRKWADDRVQLLAMIRVLSSKLIQPRSVFLFFS